MSYGDSKAVFKRRCEEIGFESDVTELIVNHGLDTMAKFAFACNFSPGSADESPLVQLTKEVFKRPATTVEMSCVRRLFSESYADIKYAVEATDDMPTRKLAPAERADRLRLQQQRLSGINISGPYEPGDALADRCIAIYDADRIQFIPWDICTSREHEILHGSKRDQTLTFDSSGALKLHKQARVEPCSTASEIQVRYCLTRRALAMEQANIVSFRNMEAWSEKMMQARLDEPPPTYVKTTMKQLESADRKLFLLITEKTREGIKCNAQGRPVDTVFKEKARGKGFGKPQGTQDSFVRIPKELLGLGSVAATPKGHRLCFSYNLKTCSNPVDKQRCSKGLHACAVKGCHVQHPAVECTRAKRD